MTTVCCKLKGAMTSEACYDCYKNNEAGYSEALRPASRLLCKKQNLADNSTLYADPLRPAGSWLKLKLAQGSNAYFIFGKGKE